jgi:hypothetical protein
MASGGDLGSVEVGNISQVLPFFYFDGSPNKKGKSCDFADALKEDFQMDNRYFFGIYPNVGGRWSDRKPIPKLNLGIGYFQGGYLSMKVNSQTQIDK